jgi:signal transduction histidine kinase
MRLSIKAKQVAGVTSIVSLAAVALSAVYLSALMRVRLEESQARGELLASAILQRANALVGGPDPYAALGADQGMQSILEASAYDPNMTYAAIVNPQGVAVAHSDAEQVGRPMPEHAELAALLDRGVVQQFRTLYSDEGRTLEVRQPLFLQRVGAGAQPLDSQAFGSIRIGVSTLLIRQEVTQAMRPALVTVAAAIVGSSIVAILLAQLLLRPIHLIRESLSRFGERDFGLAHALPRDEFGELGESLSEASARLLAGRASSSEGPGGIEPVAGWLQDGVAVFDAQGTLVYVSAEVGRMLPPEATGRRIDELLPEGHPYRTLVEARLSGVPGRRAPAIVRVARPGQDAELSVEQAIRCELVEGARAGSPPMGVLLIARDLERLRQVRSDLNSSRRVATFGRLAAGLAHEMKNRLNATAIQLELFREELAEQGGADQPLQERASVINGQIQRLAQVVQGFLKFIRPEQLNLEPTPVSAIVSAVLPIVEAEAVARHVDVRVHCPDDVPELVADSGLLEQAFLNLALNACQAMPHGGTLRISAASAWGRYVEVLFEDTGVGIPAEDLGRIFDLYYTTKEGGSGIGLSMVFRAIHLHDGEIEVQSTPGRGTTFRVLLPQA